MCSREVRDAKLSNIRSILTSAENLITIDVRIVRVHFDTTDGSQNDLDSV